MAIIPQGIRPFIRAMKSDPAALAALRAEHPSKDQLRALLQGVEDYFEQRRPQIKNAMEQSAGVTISDVLAKKIIRVWMQLKFGGE